MNLNSKNQPENFIHFKHQKLLKINQPPSFSPIENQKNDFEQSNQRLNRRINNFKKIHNKNKKEQEDYELKKNIANFYRNPFQYMEFLAKNHFIQQAKTLENLEIKQEMIDNFRKLCYQIEDHIQKFTTNEEMKLKKLQREVESKLKGNILPLNNESRIDYSNNQNMEQKNMNINNSNNVLNSAPANMNDEELMRRVFGNFTYGQSPFDGITTTGNAANFVINKKISNLNEDNLYLNALSCLKGDKIVAPKNKFIAVKELNLNDINQKKIVDTQNINDLKVKMKVEQKMNQIKKEENKSKNKNKNIDELISYSNNHIKKMEQYQKEKEILLEALKNKLNKDFEEIAIKSAMNKLTICEKNLDEIKLKYNKAPENKICDWETKKEELEKSFKETQNRVDKFLNGSKKVRTKNPNRTINSKVKKKRTNSAIPYKNKTFNNYKFK